MTRARQFDESSAGRALPDPGELVATNVQELVPYGIFTTDSDLRIRSWNRWLVTQSGLPAESVIGHPVGEVFPDLGKRHVLEKFARALSGEISVLSAALHKYLLPLPAPLGTGAPSHMLQTARIAPLSVEGRVIGTISIIEDVTQREVQAAILNRQHEIDRLLGNALEALLASEDPAKDIGDLLATLLPPLGLDVYCSYLPAVGGRELRLNSVAGVSPKHRETLATLPIADRDLSVGPGRVKGLPGTLAAHERILEGIGLGAYCCLPLILGGRVIGLMSFGAYRQRPIPPDDVTVLGRIARYVALAVDRADREREIRAASRAKDDFLATLSHELRTPLNPVLLLASDSAANDGYSVEAREAFQLIEKNALLEARLIDDLLDLTRIGHGKVNLEIRPVNVHGALRDALITVRSEVNAKSLALEVDIPAEERIVMGDSARLQQVFWNVLKNAVKFTPAGGTVRVTSELDAAGEQVAIRISDTGIGMEPREIERAFGAFSQGDHAENRRGHRFGGLGLGLAISHNLLALHSGRIEAESGGRDQGATFTIRLPLAPAGATVVKSGATATPKPVPVRHAAGARRGARLLLVEDHEPTRGPLTRLLARRGYDVVAVDTVAAAQREAAAQSFDLVLSDIGLPDGDGFTLMRELRDRYGLKGIALTGYGADTDLIRSDEAGFVDHLTKPIAVSSLDRSLEKVIGASGASDG